MRSAALKSSTATIITPPPPTIYTGPAVPTAYNPNWGRFKNLTEAQVAWFQSQPEDLTKYAHVARWQLHQKCFGASVALVKGLQPPYDDASTPVATPDIASLHAAVTAQITDSAKQIEASYATLAAVNAGISAKTITSRAQIDAALAPPT
jgi:hypothetical protein